MSNRVRDRSLLKTLSLAVSLALVASACAPLAASPVPSPAPASTAIPSPTAPPIHTPLPFTVTVAPTATATSTAPTPSGAGSPSPSPTPGPRVCSPLQDVPLSELPKIIAGNVFQTPQPGRDDGHPGIDLAFYSYGSHKTMLGLPILAALPGRVAAVLPDRKPYGNLVIIETPLEQIPASWIQALRWPATPVPTVQPDGRLTCPNPLETPAWNTARRSLYLAYGHMNQLSPLRLGDVVICGQPIGEAGTTGASVNPHLHFEARLGPAGAIFTSFGHYDARSTALERNNYCLWRVSNWFQLVDPLPILQQS